MMVRTNHDFMGHKEQVAKRQSCFGSFYFTLGFRNAVLGSFCVLFCLQIFTAISSKYNASILKKTAKYDIKIKSYMTFNCHKSWLLEGGTLLRVYKSPGSIARW